MPKLWNVTIEAHRREVRDAVLDATAAIVAAHGLRGVTMSRVAEDAGIGRATLYKYFPDADAVLRAWHERQVARHVCRVTEAGDRAGSPGERLAAVLEAYAAIARESRHHDADLAAALHRGGHVGEAERRLREVVGGLLAEAREAGEVRDDAPPEELAAYCLHALAAAGGLSSAAAVRRLVAVTLDGLRPRP